MFFCLMFGVSCHDHDVAQLWDDFFLSSSLLYSAQTILNSLQFTFYDS